MFWRIGWQQSSKRPQGLEGSCTYSMLLAIWCLQGTARSTGLGLGRVGFTLSPLRRYWCIPVASRSWASGSPSVSARFSDVAPAKVRGRNGCGELSRASKIPTAWCACIFPSLSACSSLRFLRPSMHCEVPGPILVQPSGRRIDRPSFIAWNATHFLVWVPSGSSLSLVRGDALAARVEVCTETSFSGLGNGPILVSFVAQPCSFHGPQFFLCPKLP